MVARVCEVTNCGLKHKAKGLCRTHWQQKYDKAYRQRNAEKIKKYRKERHLKTRERALVQMSEYRQQNRQKIAEARKRYYHANKERCLQMSKNWTKRNPEKRKRILERYNTKRQAQLRFATPKWVDKQKLEDIYNYCPQGYVVDHIIPLLNSKVCGLHVPWNLQYLTLEENFKKGNRL